MKLRKPTTIEANLYKLTGAGGRDTFVLAMDIADAVEKQRCLAPDNTIDIIHKVEIVHDVYVTAKTLEHHFPR